MPLFSSKFKFKKSSPRSRKNSIIQTKSLSDDESDRSSNDEYDNRIEQSEEEYPQQNRREKRDVLKSKRNFQRSSSSPMIFFKNEKLTRDIRKKSLSLINDQNDLILMIDTFRSFRFDRKKGVWLSLEQEKNQSNRIKSNSNQQTIVVNNEIYQQKLEENEKKISEMSAMIESLREKNRLLKLKIEILIEMVCLLN